MKKIFLMLIGLVAFLNISNAQNDTMYIMKSGVIINTYNVNTEIDSIIFYKPQNAISTFTDTRDGTIYKMVTIGNQVWMAENLKYLPSVVGPTVGSIATPCYYVYDYNGTSVSEAKKTENYTTYGVLYNWPAAMANTKSSSSNPSGVQGVCPAGWHLPSDAEWTELTDYLGGLDEAGGKLKEIGTTHWTVHPNNGATNESGFTALGAGYRYNYEIFYDLRDNAYWWSATEHNDRYAWYRNVGYSHFKVGRNNDLKDEGFSVRCVKD